VGSNTETQTAETYTVAEARAKIGNRKISLNGLYAAIRRGDVPHIRLGSKILIPRSWLMDKLAGGTAARK
jgi:hypothetical protein